MGEDQGVPNNTKKISRMSGPFKDFQAMLQLVELFGTSKQVSALALSDKVVSTLRSFLSVDYKGNVLSPGFEMRCSNTSVVSCATDNRWKWSKPPSV